ncbi:glycoside hydrolase family 16 [Beutenbergia cavernae DSM 12333]|uniref:Glycoside hydrolase family 16 n=1 Tax=Beutenbergia cavernae (strain ATCC BAA-8 / DSM 12333 / CCUG 43141 / JCM 11478 / NBRC 16432 / NCIMB 13614 / HKI 0122) TaxID=471853 RepID=C5BXR3_BEUC1|nr:glycoside hydrolase family 16 protein [Beutenbergia cavernae]ACQ78807.1 glycoside hydrolase family 16 [Beutenbergia cavernae DSM 12333]
MTTLLWSDDFADDGAPDPARWSHAVGGHGWGNDELQFYTSDRARNARVSGGRLVIEAHAEDWQDRRFTSARLVSRAAWLHARVEVTARLPIGRGTWPAIWMLPSTPGERRWPDDGEIDVMEHVGHDPGVVHASIHTAAYNHVDGTQRTATTAVPDAQEAFHTYAVDWDAESITWSVDGEASFTYAREAAAERDTWPFDTPFHLILNLAVGGGWGGAQGVDDAAFPARFEIDSVRVLGR